MSSLQRGFAAAIGVVFVGSIAFLLPAHDAVSRLSHGVLSDMAQIGATLLVAYAVEISWFVKQSRVRGGDRENWIGFVSGLGVSGAFGIGFALALSGHRDNQLNHIEQLGAAWSVFSLALLAGLVGVLPSVLYEWVHSLRTEYSDE